MNYNPSDGDDALALAILKLLCCESEVVFTKFNTCQVLLACVNCGLHDDENDDDDDDDDDDDGDDDDDDDDDDLTSLIVCVGSTSTPLGAVSMLSEISVLIAIRIWPLAASFVKMTFFIFDLYYNINQRRKVEIK